jgi:phosphoenolpyruvate synthase/pyruvate phosphate dikinase
MAQKWIYRLEELRSKDNDRVGKKCANLGEMVHMGMRVPPGFAISVDGYEKFMDEMGAWKFDQYYDSVPGMEDEHNDFVRDEAIPMMKQLGVPVTHGWRLSVGTGPRILAECTARSFADIASAVDSAEYRKLARTLKKRYTTNFSSRILSPTGRIEVPYLIKGMMKGF